ncbi:MAG: putative lipid II flippase FtsW [Clostridia bacterium]
MFTVEIKRNKHNNKFFFDFILLALVLGLVIFGIIMVYSASNYSAEVNYKDPFFFMKKQIIGAVLGLILMIVLSMTNYHLLFKLRYYILAVGLLCLIIVLIPGIGKSSYGARRWINLGFFTIQASEIAKFAFVIFSASVLAKNAGKMQSFRGALPVIVVGLFMCVLIMLEPNMSITICLGLVMMIMLFIGGMKLKHFALLLIPLLICVPLLILAEPYRLARLSAFLNPWASPQGEGFQLIQSLYGLGSGGFFGLGLFSSRQKYLFLPFAESDFIFSIIGEELGLFGCFLLIVVYLLLIFRAIKIARNSFDRFGCYLASGIASIIAVQVVINIAVVTGSIPPTGLPLPFISAGSSSLIMFMASIGILQNISACSKKNKYSSVMASSLSVKPLSKKGISI